MRHVAWLGILGLVIAATGCGTDGDTPAGGARGKAQPREPWAVVMTFDVEIAGAQKEGRIPAERDAAEVLEEVLGIVRARLRDADVGRHGVAPRDDRGFDVGFAALPAERHDEIVLLVTRAGTLEFLIEVLPDAEYRKRAEPDDEAPARLGLWPPSADPFAKFKEAEIRAWKTAANTGTPYVPTTPGYRLVLESGKDGSDPAHFHVVEVPATPEETFDGRMLTNAFVSVDVRNMPTVVFDVRAAWQQRFEAWTTKNLRLPLAVLLDGVFHSAPTIRAPLSTSVQITLGRGRRADQEREAKALAAVLQAGSLPVRPQLIQIDAR